jgi:hypothetical protein
MAVDEVCFPSNIFMLEGDDFYQFLETVFSSDIKELARMQECSSARLLLYSRRNFLDFLLIESDDASLIAIRKLAAFHDRERTWTVEAGIEYDINCLISSINQVERHQTTTGLDDSIFVSTDSLSRFHWLRYLIRFCQNYTAN